MTESVNKTLSSSIFRNNLNHVLYDLRIFVYTDKHVCVLVSLLIDKRENLQPFEFKMRLGASLSNSINFGSNH